MKISITAKVQATLDAQQRRKAIKDVFVAVTTTVWFRIATSKQCNQQSSQINDLISAHTTFCCFFWFSKPLVISQNRLPKPNSNYFVDLTLTRWLLCCVHWQAVSGSL